MSISKFLFFLPIDGTFMDAHVRAHIQDEASLKGSDLEPLLKRDDERSKHGKNRFQSIAKAVSQFRSNRSGSGKYSRLGDDEAEASEYGAYGSYTCDLGSDEMDPNDMQPVHSTEKGQNWLETHEKKVFRMYFDTWESKEIAESLWELLQCKMETRHKKGPLAQRVALQYKVRVDASKPTERAFPLSKYQDVVRKHREEAKKTFLQKENPAADEKFEECLRVRGEELENLRLAEATQYDDDDVKGYFVSQQVWGNFYHLYPGNKKTEQNFSHYRRTLFGGDGRQVGKNMMEIHFMKHVEQAKDLRKQLEKLRCAIRELYNRICHPIVPNGHTC
jgi:hypothetical protein